MNKLKTLILIIFFSLFLFSFNSYGFSHKNSLVKSISNKDSILVFKSELREVIKFDSNNNPLSSITETTNYHIINFDTSEIILFFKREGKNEWSSQSFEYYSTREDSETIEFDTRSDISRKVYLDINPFTAITYSFTSGIILSFDNLKTIKNDDFNKLGIYEWKDSFELIEYSKQIIINELIKDFEYSEYWRKESFKNIIDYIQQIMNKEDPKCKIIKRSSYNPSIVRYIGNQGFQVKLYAEYDCNQNYINQAYFWVNAYYLGYGKWDLELVDQKLTH